MKKSRRSKKKTTRAASAVEDDSISGLKKLGSLIEEAEIAIDSFNYDEAEIKLKEILQIDSNNHKCLEMLSGIYIEKFQWPEAEDLLKRCIEISPEDGYSKYFSIAQLCEGLESVNYYEKGIQILQKQLENNENIDPSKNQNDATLLRNLSDAYCSIAELFMTDCSSDEKAEEKCFTAVELAIKSDPSNPEAHQCSAAYHIEKDQLEQARQSMQKSLSLWLPNLESEEVELDGQTEERSEKHVPVYDSRIKTSKLLMEIEMFHEASKVLESLIDEDDEVVEVWYLLGLLNYIRGEEYQQNALFYLRKAKEVSIKMENDECIKEINELLAELDTIYSEDTEDDDNESDYTTDSQPDEEMNV